VDFSFNEFAIPVVIIDIAHGAETFATGRGQTKKGLIAFPAGHISKLGDGRRIHPFYFTIIPDDK